MTDTKNNPHINVLWTGGLDSSYRICELSRLNVTVRPIYVKDAGRHSTNKELAAMNIIVALLMRHPDTRFNLLPIFVIDKNEIEKDVEITESYNILSERYRLGSQYDFLARLANQLNEDLEIGATFDPRGKIARSIYGEGAVPYQDKTSDIELEYLNIDFSEASLDIKKIFQRLKMPISLFHITKTAEYSRLCEMGLKEVADNTWFCHDPVMGFTCGMCNPCKDALHEGMAWRVSKTGFLLGLFRYVIRKIKRITTIILVYVKSLFARISLS